eukprot:8411399-Pyramimonas_sp.AAC.1
MPCALAMPTHHPSHPSIGNRARVRELTNSSRVLTDATRRGWRGSLVGSVSRILHLFSETSPHPCEYTVHAYSYPALIVHGG